jgi:hypothetical protein
VDAGATTALVARITLAAAFALSAGTKLAHRKAFAAALEDFGVPQSHAVAPVLPVVEGGLAALLLVMRNRPWPAFLAIGVLALFTAAVVANLLGERPAPCPCFGPPAAGARPVSAATVARNGCLVGLAVLATGPTDGASVGTAAAAALVTVTATLVALRRFG